MGKNPREKKSSSDDFKQHRESDQFKGIKTMTDAERENLELRKQNEKLKMENEILKQARLILAKKKDM